MCTAMYKTASGILLYSAGCLLYLIPQVLCDDPNGQNAGAGGSGRELQEGEECVCTHIYITVLASKAQKFTNLQTGCCSQLIPFNRLFAQVEIFQRQGYSSQEKVLPQRFCTQYTQLKFSLSQGFFAISTVHKLQQRQKETADYKSFVWFLGLFYVKT